MNDLTAAARGVEALRRARERLAAAQADRERGRLLPSPLRIALLLVLIGGAPAAQAALLTERTLRPNRVDATVKVARLEQEAPKRCAINELTLIHVKARVAPNGDVSMDGSRWPCVMREVAQALRGYPRGTTVDYTLVLLPLAHQAP